MPYIAPAAATSAARRGLGCYLHALFEDAGVLQALFGAGAPTLDDVFDGLAHTLADACAPGVLQGLIGRWPGASGAVPSCLRSRASHGRITV